MYLSSLRVCSSRTDVAAYSVIAFCATCKSNPSTRFQACKPRRLSLGIIPPCLHLTVFHRVSKSSGFVVEKKVPEYLLFSKRSCVIMIPVGNLKVEWS